MSWQTAKVGDLCEQIRGVTYAKADASTSPKAGYLPVLRANNITDNGLDFNDLVYVPINQVRPKQQIRRGDVVIATSSGSISVVGKAARAHDDFAGGFGAFCKVLRPNEKVDAAYFAHYFQTPEYRQTVSGLAAGANINNLRNEHLNELAIPLPPLPEQRRIAAILDKADALRAKRRQAIAKLDQLLQSVFLEMFGDPVTNPKGWGTTSLGEIAREKLSNGIFKKNSEYSDNGLPVVWVEQLFRGHELDVTNARRLDATQKEIQTYGLLPGDLLFCRSSLKLDGIAYNNLYGGAARSALFECHLIRLRTKTDIVEPAWLNYMLRTTGMRARLKQRAKTSTMTTIDQEGLSNVDMALPPLALQQAFCLHLSRTMQEIEGMNLHLERLKRLFEALQSQAFSGAF